MIHIKSYENFLFEVGSGTSEKLSYEKIADGEYRISVPNKGNLILKFVFNKSLNADLSFLHFFGIKPVVYSATLYVEEDRPGSLESDVTNWGKPLTVMTTVVEIFREFIAEKDPDIITFTGVHKERPDNIKDFSSRSKLYDAYVRAYIGKLRGFAYTIWQGCHVIYKKNIEIDDILSYLNKKTDSFFDWLFKK